MRLRFATFAFLAFSAVLYARETGIEVRPSGKELLETEAQRMVTTVFRVTNHGTMPRELTSEVLLPEGWKLITEDLPFTLGGNEIEVKLLSIQIPQGTRAGIYPVTYRVWSRKFPSLSDAWTIQVAVLPTLALHVELVDAPESVVAGESYQASFRVSDGSNVLERVGIRIESGENFPASFRVEDSYTRKARSKIVVVTVETDGTIRRSMKHGIRLEARLRDGDVTASARSSVEIIPRMTGVADRYHRLPVQVMASHVYHGGADSGNSGFQGELSGEGTLDVEGRRSVRFRLRGPDIYETSFLAEHDEYFMSYESKGLQLHLGDRVFSLSPLTENSRYGRGVESSFHVGGLSAGGFYQRARWIEPVRDEWAGYVRASMDGHRICLNYLKKLTGENCEPDGDLFSLDALIVPFEDTRLEMEYALGSRNGDRKQAYRVRLLGRFSRFHYLFHTIQAEPDFPGYYQDTRFLVGNFSVYLTEKIRVNAGFRKERQNVDVDTTQYSAPYSEFYQAGLQIRLWRRTSFAFDWLDRNREDRQDTPKFNYRERTIRARLDQHIGRFAFSASAETGETSNRLIGGAFRMQRFTASVSYRPGSNQFYRGYAYYDNNHRTTGVEQPQLTVGLNASIRMGMRTDLSLAFQNNYSPEEYLQDRNLLEARLSHTLSFGHRVSLRGRHTLLRNTEDEDETAVIAEYRIPIGVPVSRKGGLGRLRGSVVDAGTGLPRSHVILRINGATAVTDRHGAFEFPSLKPGEYHLQVDPSSIGLREVTVQRMPMTFLIGSEEERSLTVGITKASTLRGQVLLGGYTEDARDAERFVIGSGNAAGGPEPEDAGEGKMADILIEIERDGDVHRRVSDRQGRFCFEDLRPGAWRVKVYPYNVPEHHFLEKETFDIQLMPAQKEEIVVRILPRKRRIRMVQDGGIVMQEKQTVRESPQARYGKALRAYENGDYRNAIQMFVGVLADHPEERLTKNCRYWIGKSYHALGEYRKAIEAFQTVMQN